MPDNADAAKAGFDKHVVDSGAFTGHSPVAEEMLQQVAEAAADVMPSGKHGKFTATHEGAFSGMGHVVSGGSLVGKGEDAIVVDTNDIRNTAQLATTHMHDIDELVSELQQEMAATESTWFGVAGNWYRDVFLTSTNKFKKVLEELGATYPRELIAYADEHEGADSRAKTAAAEVEQVNV